MTHAHAMYLAVKSFWSATVADNYCLCIMPPEHLMQSGHVDDVIQLTTVTA